MKQAMPPLGALRAFEAAARHLSFTDAARELNVSQAAVSQQVRVLEHYLRHALFHRLPRHLQLTEIGGSYLPVVQDVLERLTAGTIEIFGQRHDRPITLKIVSTFAVGWLAPRLPHLLHCFPDVPFRIFTFQWNTDFDPATVDLEIRYGDGNWSGVHVEPLLQDEIFPVCSPGLLDGPLPIQTPLDLARHTLIHVIGARIGWPTWLRVVGLKDFETDLPTIQVDSSLLAYLAVMSGGCVALGRTLLVEKYLATGRLVAPFELRAASDEAYYLLRPRQRTRRPEIELLCNWFKAEVGSYLRDPTAWLREA